MDIEENGKITPSGDFSIRQKTEEDNTLAVTTEQANPFEDPLQRTKCLIQYIRLRKQRAEAEQAKRNALKKQKMTARATLQSAREEKAAAEMEERQCARKIEEMNQEKHQVLAALKAIHSRETERKRKREEQERQRRALAEEQRRREEQRRIAAQQPQQSLATLEYILQLKNAQQTLSAIIASATGESAQLGTPAVGGHSLASSLSPSLLTFLIQNSLGDVAGAAPQNAQVGTAASLPLSANSFTNFPTVTQQQQRIVHPPHNQSSSTSNVTTNQQHSQQHQLHLQQQQQQQQQQQVQNAVAQLLRQQLPTGASGLIGMNALLNAAGTSGGQTQIGQTFPNIGTFPAQQHQFDLQTLAAAAAAAHCQSHNQQQLSSALNLQALVGGGTMHQSPNPITSTATASNIPGISQELLYQATLLAAANLSNNPGLITSNTTPQQQQRPK